MTKEEFIKNISEEGEEWRDIPSYEGLYMISSFGKIVALGNYGGDEFYRKRWMYPKIHKPIINNKGYERAYLQKDKKSKQFFVHRLVAQIFIPNPNNYNIVDHIDTNTRNNRVENLKWCTQRMNNLNPISRSKRDLTISKDEEKSRWVAKKVVGINGKGDIKYYDSVALTISDGFNPSAVSAVCLGKNKSHHGYVWYYEPDYIKLVNKSKNSSPEGTKD